jgi:N-acetylmuramoyl-L-alanine amidase
MKDIRQQFIQYNESVRSVAPYYIVVHDTGDPGATDENEHDYFAGGNRGASADFFVDRDSITQIIDTDKYYSWHCGDGGGAYGIRNSNSLGIEMCLEEDGTISSDTIQNTRELILYLMNKYNIPLDRVVRHYDASRKCCPSAFSANNWARWYDFKNVLANGEVINGKWEIDNKGWWYQNSNGTYPRDCWSKIDGKWYLFDGSGYMEFGWKTDEGNWYYLGGSGDGSMKTGWIQIDSKWYHLDDSGAMQVGWIKVNDYWYYLDASGAMQTGWLDINGFRYLTYSTGELIVDTDIYGYHFDEKGHATKIK